MEINLNCDLGEKSKHHSNENDPDLLKIVNSANVACGYHAGDEETMREVVVLNPVGLNRNRTNQEVGTSSAEEIDFLDVPTYMKKQVD